MENGITLSTSLVRGDVWNRLAFSCIFKHHRNICEQGHLYQPLGLKSRPIGAGNYMRLANRGLTPRQLAHPDPYTKRKKSH